jgi:NADH-quinone oxidoreductase subunit N
MFLSISIALVASLFCMYLLQDYTVEYKIKSAESYLLMLYAMLGLTMLVIVMDFGVIFLTLVVQSLSLYMLSGFKRNSIYSIESGLKYFILGAFSAACFLLGWSLFLTFFFLTFFLALVTKLKKML